MNQNFYCLFILALSFVFSNCQEQKAVRVKNVVPVENDSLIPFTIELVKSLDNKIKWSRNEFDSTTSKNIEIHRPIFFMLDKLSQTESIEEIDLFKYFTEEELSQAKYDTLDFNIVKRYNSVNNNVIEINWNTSKFWFEETDRLRHDNPKEPLPPSFQWYFSISKPVLAKNGKCIYFELFECNIDRESIWVYIFRKENGVWNKFYVNESKIKI